MIKFIVIDDEPYVGELFPKLINWEEFNFKFVGVFSSAADALNWLETDICDVIFTDISMPDISGTELAKICSEKYPDISIVFFSAHRDFDYAMEAIKYKVFDYILKPFSYDDLNKTIAALRKHVEAKRIQNPAGENINNNDDDDIIRAAKNFIMEHYSDDIAVNDVAKHVGLSDGYFSTIFKQRTNENFVTTLKKVRLAKAKELLRTRNVKISTIPHQIGFKSYSYFTKVFQSEFNETPTDYRNSFFNIKNKD